MKFLLMTHTNSGVWTTTALQSLRANEDIGGDR